jgi:hypothetical protein
MDLYGSIMLLHVLRYAHAIARLSVRAHTTDARALFVCGVARDQPVHHPPSSTMNSMTYTTTSDFTFPFTMFWRDFASH